MPPRFPPGAGGAGSGGVGSGGFGPRIGLINAGWPEQVVKKVLRITDPSVLRELTPELTANIELETDPVEWWALKLKRAWATHHLTPAGGAGNFSAVEIGNPAGSGIVSVVTHVKNISNTVVMMSMGTPAGLAGSAFSCEVRDSRLFGGRATTTGRDGYALAASTGVERWHLASPEVTPSDWFMILFPGSVLDIIAQTVNVSMEQVVMGYERPVTPDELKLQ